MLNGNRCEPVLKPGTSLESEKPVIDFARVRTFSWVIGVGSPAGARRVEGDHQPEPAPFPANDGTPSRLRTINIAGSCALKTVRGEGTGERLSLIHI